METRTGRAERGDEMTARESIPGAMGSPMGSTSGKVSTDTEAQREAAGFKIPYEDLRQWIAETEKLGEIRHVKGASWQEEIGMGAGLGRHDENAPRVIFDEVPGCKKGQRVLVNFFGGKRKNKTLGFPLAFSKLELSQAFLENYMRDLKPIPHQFVDTGPVMENVLTGDAIDITNFPVPTWPGGDGGGHIGTGSYNITIDPEEKWINVGTYRVMIHDKNTLGFYMSPGKHGRIPRDKYQARNEPMPVAIVVGGPLRGVARVLRERHPRGADARHQGRLPP